MSYTALYRKFRPQSFVDVKGQDHIVTTLKNQIKSNRVGHAYLFCGTRGTGKTTVAKLLAKAVNCEHPVDGNPCNECSMCQKINQGISLNVVEIDAASNNGVDNIREIIDEVRYSPTEGNYKVYIIDEVHMLSTGAFNALLKTLEEPPHYVMFILATTEVHKIPVTILSRCQRYDFRRLSIDTIAERIRELTEIEHVAVEDKAIRYIAKAADGAMRDALSLLDQCIAFYFGEELTYDRVLEVLGAVDVETFAKMLRFIQANDVLGCIQLLEELTILGRDLAQFTVDFTWYLRNLLLVKSMEDASELVEVSSDNYAVMQQMVETLDTSVLMRYIRIFSELSNQIRYSSQKRVMIEVALIKLCKPVMERNYDSILNRLKQLEDAVQNGVVVARSNGGQMGTRAGDGANGQVAQAGGQSGCAGAIKPKVLPEAVPEEIMKVAKSWATVINKLALRNQLAATVMKNATPSLGNGNQLLLVFHEGLDKTYVDKEEHMAEITEAINEIVGRQIQIQTKLVETTSDEADNMIDLTKVIKNVEIEYED